MLEISAEPTKEFFVDMLIRDIALDRAILDLIDNSIDGARRFRINKDFTGLYINITINKNEFIIEDNCGGISKEIAIKQAFRFGKPKDYNTTDHSIGRFGIGMKRGLFKIGEDLFIKSVHEKSNFEVNFNVHNWLKEENWNFPFQKEPIDEKKHSFECHTIIKVTDLHKNIIPTFEKDFFIKDLRKTIALTHSLIIKKGLSIYLNNEKISREKFFIKNEFNLVPYIKFFDYVPFPEEPNKKVNIRIIAGVTGRALHEGGWNIFCNDRMIVYADQTTVTGWEKKNNSDNDPIGLYHHDFALFRGYVEFDANDAALLPWTTTKTGLDTDSKVYKAALFEMKSAMREIIPFLRKRATEERKFKKGVLDSSPLTELVNNSDDKEFFNFEKEDKKFYSYAPEPKVIAKEPEDKLQEGTIQYIKPKEDIELLKKHLRVTSNKDVGIKTFNYYIDLVKG